MSAGRAPRKTRATKSAVLSPIALSLGPYDISPPSRTGASVSKIVGRFHDAPAVEHGQRIGHHQDGVGPLARHLGESMLEIVGLAHAQGLDFDAEEAGRILGGAVA